MFYVLSKVLGFFLVPSNIMVGLGLVGILLLPTRYARAGHRLLVASVILIALVGVLPVGNWLTLPLEERLHAAHGSLIASPSVFERTQAVVHFSIAIQADGDRKSMPFEEFAVFGTQKRTVGGNGKTHRDILARCEGNGILHAFAQ